MPFEFKKMEIPDLSLIQPRVFWDERGFFLEFYKESDFVKNGITEKFVQDNHSFSTKNILRGLHYQLSPKTQGKLVRVVKGKVWDVAVDIRRSSPTFKKWVGVELSEENHTLFWIPSGFAHGFVALTDEVHLLYKCTEEYDSILDRGIRWNDPELKISWPVSNPLLSPKDEALPLLKDAEIFK